LPAPNSISDHLGIDLCTELRNHRIDTARLFFDYQLLCRCFRALKNFEVVTLLAKPVLRRITNTGCGKHSKAFLLGHCAGKLDRIYRINRIESAMAEGMAPNETSSVGLETCSSELPNFLDLKLGEAVSHAFLSFDDHDLRGVFRQLGVDRLTRFAGQQVNFSILSFDSSGLPVSDANSRALGVIGTTQ